MCAFLWVVHNVQCSLLSVFSETLWLFPALPSRFIEDLGSQEVTEGTTATLRCQLSKMASVEWRKGAETLRDGDRYSLRQDGTVCELRIRNLAMADAGEYSCVCGQERTSATLSVRGKDHLWPHDVAFCPALCLPVPSTASLLLM